MTLKEKQYVRDELKRTTEQLQSCIHDFKRYAEAGDYTNLLACCTRTILAIARYNAAQVLHDNLTSPAR